MGVVAAPAWLGSVSLLCIRALSPVTLGKRPISAPTFSYPNVYNSLSNLILLLDFITQG